MDTHNHPADMAEVEDEKIVDAMKTKARETVQPIRAVYHHEELQAVATRLHKEEVAANLPSLSHLNTSLKERFEANSITLPEFVRGMSARCPPILSTPTHKHMKHLKWNL